MKESFVMILLLIIVPTILPFFIIMIAGNLKYNKKIKKVIMIILSIIYNGIIGVISQLLCFGILCITEVNYIWIFCSIIVFIILLVPLNIFMKRKGNINKYIYIIANVVAFLITCLGYISIMKGQFDL